MCDKNHEPEADAIDGDFASTELATQDQALSPAAQLKLAQERAAIQGGLLQVMLSVTKPQHWSEFGDTLYLDVSGCMAVADLRGLTIEPGRCEIEKVETEDGQFNEIFHSTCKVSGPDGRSVTEIGTRSLQDQFFYSQAVGQSNKGKSKDDREKDVPLCRVNRANVRKASQANATVRAVTKYCGLGGITKLDLQEARLDTTKIGKVAMNTEAKADPELLNKLREILKPITTNPKEADGIICVASSFVGKDGEIVKTQSTSVLAKKPDWAIKNLREALTEVANMDPPPANAQDACDFFLAGLKEQQEAKR